MDENQWWDIIKKELKGDDPSTLIHRLRDGIVLEPFAMKTPGDFTPLPLFPAGYPEAEEHFDLTGANIGALRGQIMSSLELGCRCITFCGTRELPDAEELLKDVVPEYIELRVSAALWEYISPFKEKHPQAAIYCMEMFDDLPGKFHKDQRFILPARVEMGTQSLAHLLSTADRIATLLTDAGMSDAEAWQCLETDLKGSPAIVENIAAMRALHMLWFQLSKLRTGEVLRPVIRYVATDDHDDSIPHNRLIDLSLEAVSATLGGAMLFKTEVPAFSKPETGRRLVKNIFHLLREEAGLSRRADPVMGSYSIEKLTIEMARTAWNLFVRSS